MHTQHRIEHALRRKLSGPSRQDVQQTMGWDKGAMSRFLSGEQGVLIDKLDTLVGVCGYVLVTRKYMDAVATLGEVGMFCECAREGLGECGRPQAGTK
ncbi:DNA-binding protein [Ralstonia sp. CHL-2022]|uniref:DNA-binding protein n=1 Tax=Ralstonia mojiangensis TaxID=2953895 RepID=A0AAE3I332_9RALS|nr:DNA-binding protein [Ralstonia mojiangensis]MCT7316768.1 DNA-binding protein [Ralstonia mojiangensis]